ncbi:MAG: hypothetical protein JJ939_03460 [Alphaproteobacteria bacterium]|nr:hypothetical protein [Alphaproteobacteria bacterium]MBO6627459.1 hypothetical protein [Alphaproteobacteria bacterium]MDF1627098.1 hypothetical protein [Parvibaculaceae bacterium]
MKQADHTPSPRLDTASNAVSSEKAVLPANEDSPATGQLYRLLARKPDHTTLTIAAGLTFLWAGVIVAYVSGFYGLEGLKTAPRAELALLGAATFGPATLIWLVAFTVWRTQEMRIMADALARTALRLTEPEETAKGDLQRLGNAVASHLAVMAHGLDQTFTRAQEINILLNSQLAEIDQGSERAEKRAERLNALLNEHKSGLKDLATALGNETDTVARMMSNQVATVRGATTTAEQKLGAASERLRQQTEALTRASETVIAGADATTSTLDRQSSRLEAVAQNALSKADGLTSRYEAQRDALAEAALALETERSRLDASFEKHRTLIESTSGDLTKRTVEIDEAVARLSRELTHAMETASARATSLGSTFATEVTTITKAANDAANAVGDASRSAKDSLVAATNTFGNATDEAAQAALKAAETLAQASAEIEGAVTIHTSAAHEKLDRRIVALQEEIEKTGTTADTAAERLGNIMFGIGGAAKEAGRALVTASDELEQRMNDLPQEAAEGAEALQRVLEDQVSALASIAEIVVRHARTLDRSSGGRGSAAPMAAAPLTAAPMSPPARPTRDPAREDGNWGISDLLAAAGQETHAPKTNGSELHRRSLHIIESLQSIAIDLDRALEQSPPPDLWRRYKAGERNVFARRLYNLQGRDLLDKISDKYASEKEFRADADKFINLFDQLLNDANDRDREGILAETYLTSDTGKVYLMLAQATGRLG